MKFVRVSTRLYCDIFEAFRGLTKESRLENWAHKNIDCIDIAGTCVAFDEITSVYNQKVVWSLPEKALNLSFNLMRCGVKTEYCTEVHLMIEKNEGDIEDAEKAGLETFGKALLDQLRRHYNQDWVILDTDLHLDQLRGSI